MSERVRATLRALDKPTWAEIEPVQEEVYALGDRIFPDALDIYSELRGWRARAALVFAAMSFAKSHPDAVTLAVAALQDKSAHVRAHACMLLSLSGRKDVLPALEALLSHKSEMTRSDAARAIEDIRAAH
ncbi:hypothetical protein GQ651_02680 [Alphaproteobacteria bacterium GH1-50]|uniref:HEAT repeat protein n=1 Tax=Kangsaoukella pontilimi TaxID=2691042 RepID=A0A7C9IEG3_9RHOB|nr:HEAT repeat domain-containing protein [Kangsaoukella pontilimi]MXQ06744.1 hypothetical protein [Kangsaoukella pontilimi]